MELRHLRYFTAVAKELSFTRAAGQLNIAQPPLSTQIRQLEEELEVQLLIRSNQRVRLSAAGKAFLADAMRVLEGVEQAKQSAINASKGEFGNLALGFTSGTSYMLLP